MANLRSMQFLLCPPAHPPPPLHRRQSVSHDLRLLKVTLKPPANLGPVGAGRTARLVSQKVMAVRALPCLNAFGALVAVGSG